MPEDLRSQRLKEFSLALDASQEKALDPLDDAIRLPYCDRLFAGPEGSKIRLLLTKMVFGEVQLEDSADQQPRVQQDAGL